MKTDDYISIGGRSIDANGLKTPKAKELAELLFSGALNWASLVECRLAEGQDAPAPFLGAELVVFDVEVEVPQKKANDIRRVERIAVAFWPADNQYPETLALRSGFPLVPHLNLRTFEFPRSLCLYDIPYSELKLRWRASALVEDIRSWLSKTAEGKLHQDDQRLEPLLFGPADRIILPSNFLSEEKPIPERLTIGRISSGRDRYCLIAETVDGGNQVYGQPFVATTIIGSPQVHGVIHRQPLTLSELAQFLQAAHIDLIQLLRDRIRQWQTDTATLKAPLVIIVVLPKSRNEGTGSEQSDLWAFICLPDGTGGPKSVTTCPKAEEIGEELGLWKIENGQLAMLIPIDETKRGERVQLAMLNPCFALSREDAALLNDHTQRDNRRIVAVGMGAIGSQIFLNLIRAAYGEWTLIDKDALLPHNLARHGIYGVIGGPPKAELLAFAANNTIDGEPIATAIVTDVLQPSAEESERVAPAMANADVIFDFSASLAVARYVSETINSPARRASFFLNPTGSDSVMLMEDVGRQIPLAALEMQYYRLLIRDRDLHSHLQSAGRIRYAHSCRDISSRISQDLVAVHAAIGSRALRQSLESEGARIGIWRSGDDGSVKTVSVEASPLLLTRKAGWTICSDHLFLQEVRDLRSGHLPNETGGILIGAFDMQYRSAYIVDALPAPLDSSEEPTGFVRGRHGLTEVVEAIEAVSNGQLTYVGEWHSHPGRGVRPSNFDRKLFQWLASRMAKDSLPPLMLIVGADDRYAWYLDKMR
jgi:integrative and conjugative element protein (TIGR02256 family)